MASILVVAGSHDGTSTRGLWADFDEVYCWEPNPELWFHYEDAPDHVELIKAAAWTDDGTKPLFVGTDGIMQGSSVYRDKTTGSLGPKPIRVEAKGFSTWLERNTGDRDFVVVRMNIEGAEYSVLLEMYRDGVLAGVDELHIAWHWEKIPSITELTHEWAVAIAHCEVKRMIEL